MNAVSLVRNSLIATCLHLWSLGVYLDDEFLGVSFLDVESIGLARYCGAFEPEFSFYHVDFYGE